MWKMYFLELKMRIPEQIDKSKPEIMWKMYVLELKMCISGQKLIRKITNVILRQNDDC